MLTLQHPVLKRLSITWRPIFYVDWESYGAKSNYDGWWLAIQDQTLCVSTFEVFLCICCDISHGSKSNGLTLKSHSPSSCDNLAVVVPSQRISLERWILDSYGYTIARKTRQTTQTETMLWSQCWYVSASKEFAISFVRYCVFLSGGNSKCSLPLRALVA